MRNIIIVGGCWAILIFFLVNQPKKNENVQTRSVKYDTTSLLGRVQKTFLGRSQEELCDSFGIPREDGTPKGSSTAFWSYIIRDKITGKLTWFQFAIQDNKVISVFDKGNIQ